jgi:uncharacterized protein YaaW (UPF0174 family)
MLEELGNQFQTDPHAAMVEASTKLALEWAEQQRPITDEQLAEIIKQLLGSFKKGFSHQSDLSHQLQSAVVKSSARLSHYWYLHNKSTDLQSLSRVIENFVQVILVELSS